MRRRSGEGEAVKTAELYVEPILIGSILLIMLAFLFALEEGCLISENLCVISGDLKPEPLKLELPEGIALGALLVGLAYLLGILIDRLLDSGFEALERHNRIRFAYK